MTDPARTDVSYDLDMMIKDAKRWKDVAVVLGEERRIAANLTLTVAAFSSVAELATRTTREEGITKIYECVQQKVVRLLAEGEACMNDMAHKLAKVAEDTAASDAEANARLRRIGLDLEARASIASNDAGSR
jgi:hypothetical protein